MKSRILIAIFIILFTSTDSLALGGLSLGYGRSRNSVNIFHTGFQGDFDSRWFESNIGYLSTYYEISFNYWECEGEDVKQIACSPVLTYGFTSLGQSLLPYLEGGIGVSYITETIVNKRNMSTHFQFEDRIGFGVEIGTEIKLDLNFKYLHYSNANIKKPNEGIDIFMFSSILSF